MRSHSHESEAAALRPPRRPKPLVLCPGPQGWGTIFLPTAAALGGGNLSPPPPPTTVNPTTTRSYVEVVRGVAQRSGRPATVRGPPHVTRYILLPRAPTHPPQPPSAQQRHEGEGRGFVLRSPKDGLSAGTWRRKVVMCPRRGNDPASGHPRAHQPPLGRGTSPPAWDGRLDAPGQRRRHLPSSAWTRRREVKQGKSGGSVGTTDQGKGKGRSVVRPMGTVAYGGKGQGKGKGRGEGRLGQGGRGRSKGGEKLMGTTAYGGKGSKGRAANGDRPVGAASCRRDHHTMASCQNPPPPPVSKRIAVGTLSSGTTPLVLSQVKDLVFGPQGDVGETALIRYCLLLSRPRETVCQEEHDRDPMGGGRADLDGPTLIPLGAE